MNGRFSKAGRAALTALAGVLILSACTAVFRTQATREVTALGLNLPDLIRARAENDTALRDQINALYGARLTDIHEIEPQTKAIYTQDFGEKFRFVVDRKLTKDHEALIATLYSSFDDGMNPTNFLADQLKAEAQSVAERANEVEAACRVSLDEAGKQALIEHLTQESKNDAAPELTGTAILEWMLQPKFGAKYEVVHKAYDQTKAAILARSQAEFNTELDNAVAYFKYVRAMGLKDEMLLANWEKSLADFSGAIAAAVPNTPHYLRLRAELDRYRKLAAKHADLPKLPAPASKVQKGSSGDLVKAVQERLEMTGFYTGPITGTFDDTTKEALVQYQATHQLPTDGVVGKGTIDAMNIPFSDRVKRIRLAMAKQRKSGSRWKNYYVRVNVPEFAVEVVEDGKILRRHKVIVGNLNPLNHTPEFEAEIQKVVYNPAWFMTPRIFKNEELPKWVADEEYFTKKGYKAHFNKDGMPVAAYQPPGPGNALGRVKILFPNKHDVYLHDTPTKPLFNQTIRTFSHGCIRLQNPLDMAAFLLTKDNHPAVAEIDKILAGHGTREINLQNKVPIFIEYSTVSTNEEGHAVFLADVYKRDASALAGLDDPI
ncbi:MAG: L,D-transpeptidase family protein [Deltaproteobacteria bacterium]|nr:L,D-transpeptidase family protein [Deltaproteobacteria bacterium]